MIAESTTKIALGSFLTLGVATTSWGAYRLLNQPSKIGEELNWEENVNLLNENDSKWTKLIEKYKESKSPKGKKLNRIEDLILSQTASQEETLENKNKREFQDMCKKLWNTEISKTSRKDRERIKKEIKD